MSNEAGVGNGGHGIVVDEYGRETYKSIMDRHERENPSILSKREAFAMAAMQGFLSSDDEDGFSLADAAEYIGIQKDEYIWHEHYPVLVAKKAIAHADALLKALEANNEKENI